MSIDKNSCEEYYSSLEPYCQVKVDTIKTLKDSTRKLLCLLEEIQSKTHVNNTVQDVLSDPWNKATPIPVPLMHPSETCISTVALTKLETATRNLEAIHIEDEDDDCSVYKKLIRKCQCLNNPEYNDFVIHFNENTKDTTNNIGEIIKNLRILKRFLYMGTPYTKNALTFLTQGLRESQLSEKVEIVQGCTHADVCNIFEDHSIVVVCISWPCRYPQYGNGETQAFAAGLLFKLAELEEGRRYLNFSSKITNDIKKVLRKRSSLLEANVVENLNTTLDLLKQVFTKTMNITYVPKTVYEGVGARIINDLMKSREYMTLDEVFMYLDLLNSFTNHESVRKELMLRFPLVLMLFKLLLREYDNSEINIIITNILNNIVTKNMIAESSLHSNKGFTMIETATEPIQMKNETCQIPVKKHIIKKTIKSKLTLGIAPKNRSRWKDWGSFIPLSEKKQSKNFSTPIIIVPLEKKKDI